jgi:hypothetical protein
MISIFMGRRGDLEEERGSGNKQEKNQEGARRRH